MLPPVILLPITDYIRVTQSSLSARTIETIYAWSAASVLSVRGRLVEDVLDPLAGVFAPRLVDARLTMAGFKPALTRPQSGERIESKPRTALLLKVESDRSTLTDKTGYFSLEAGWRVLLRQSGRGQKTWLAEIRRRLVWRLLKVGSIYPSGALANLPVYSRSAHHYPRTKLALNEMTNRHAAY